MEHTNVKRKLNLFRRNDNRQESKQECIVHSYQKKEQNRSLENPQASIKPTPIDGNVEKNE